MWFRLRLRAQVHMVYGRISQRVHIYTTIMELGTERPSLLCFWGPNSIVDVYMDPLRYSLIMEYTLNYKGLHIMM